MGTNNLNDTLISMMGSDKMNLDRATRILSESIQDGVLSGDEIYAIDFLLNYIKYLHEMLFESKSIGDLSISDSNSGPIREIKSREAIANLKDAIGKAYANLNWNDLLYTSDEIEALVPSECGESCKTCKHREIHCGQYGESYTCEITHNYVSLWSLCEEYERDS